jgi:hypothetical protein
MLPTDQTHLRRYLTTLGVTVPAGTLSLAGLFLRLQQDMLVTKSTISQVTPTARVALLERQRYLAFGTSALPYFVLIGFLGGLSLAAYGLIGWQRRQKVADALEDLALSRGQVELRQMTAQEQAEELNREAEESAADVARLSSSEPGRAAAESTQDLVSDIRNRAMLLETSLASKLQAALGTDKVQANVRASGPMERVMVDALAHIGGADYVFELKYAAAMVNARKRVIDALLQVDRGVHAVMQSGSAAVVGVAVLVLPDEAEDDDLQRLDKYADEERSRFKLAHRVYIVRYSDFLSERPDSFIGAILGIRQP